MEEDERSEIARHDVRRRGMDAILGFGAGLVSVFTLDRLGFMRSGENKPAPKTHPLSMVAKSSSVVAKPSSVVTKSSSVVVKPSSVVAKPSSTVGKPSSTVAKPSSTVAKPSPPSLTPYTCSSRFDSSFETGTTKSIVVPFEREVQSIGTIVVIGGEVEITSKLPSMKVTLQVTMESVSSLELSYIRFSDVVFAKGSRRDIPAGSLRDIPKGSCSATTCLCPMTRLWPITVTKRYDPLDDLSFNQSNLLRAPAGYAEGRLGHHLYRSDSEEIESLMDGDQMRGNYRYDDSFGEESFAGITFDKPQKLKSITFMTNVNIHNGEIWSDTWRGDVIGVDQDSKRTVLHNNVILLGPGPLQVNSTKAFKSYLFAKPAGAHWEVSPTISMWKDIILL